MADDSRPPPSSASQPISEPIQLSDASPSDPNDPPRRPRRERPANFPESQASKLWRELGDPAGGRVNEMPGGTYNSAGGRPREATWRDAFRFSEFTRKDRPKFYQTSCARDSLLVGMGVGGGVFGVGFISRGLYKMHVTTSFAVGTFALTAGAMHYWCDRRRKEEAKGIAAAVTGMKMLHDKKAKEEAEKKKLGEETERIKREQEEQQKKKETWWKPW